MPGPKENTKPISDYLKSLGAVVYNEHGSHYAIGRPDLVACFRGRFVAIEVKRAKGGKVSNVQRAALDKLQKAGALVVIATTLHDFRSQFNGLFTDLE
jgi:Holliday junction resolvase